LRGNIRIRLAGVYVQNQKILLVKHRKGSSEYYLLPGGGQEPGESAHEALEREWKEELNLEAEVGNFLFFGESVPPNGLKKSQVLQLVFSIYNVKGSLFTEKSGALVGSEWIPLEQLPNIKLFPRCFTQLNAALIGKTPEWYQKYNWIHA
jgi:8-oxo-dGTP diphosphatase